MISLIPIFLTGLTTGGLACMAVQGGLLAGYLSNRREQGEAAGWQGAVAPTAAFLSAKLIIYVFIGGLLGALGSLFQLTLGWRVAFQVLAGLFMIASALKLLKVHPIFEKLELHPPASVRRVVRQGALTRNLGTPFLLGLLTVFIPCGTTQAMEVLAISSGSWVRGSSILAAFTLGTIPFFFIVGVLALASAKAYHGIFAKVTAAVVLILGLWSINGGLALSGSPFTFQNITSSYMSAVFGGGSASKDDHAVVVQNGVQEVTLNVSSSGYSPDNIELQSGVPVKLHLVTADTQGCARSFVIPKMNIQAVLPETGEQVVEFTPTAPGRLSFSCSMGMYTGSFTVI